MGMGDGRDFRKHAGRLQRKKCFVHYSVCEHQALACGGLRRLAVNVKHVRANVNLLLFSGSVFVSV